MTEPRTMAEETLAMLEEDEAMYRAPMPHALFQQMRLAMADQYAHAAACVRLVAAIDAGTLERIDKASMHVRVYAGDDVIGVTAPTALEAFALATADTTEEV